MQSSSYPQGLTAGSNLSRSASHVQAPDTECRSSKIRADRVSVAAKILYEAFIKQGRYGPIDKLGLASGPDSLLVALFELERGVRSEIGDAERRKEWSELAEIINAIASDARKPECVEHALQLAHELAVKALAGKGGGV